jgi:predicted nucleotidyltransferase
MAASSVVIDQRVAALLAASRKILRESPESLRAAVLYGSSLSPGFRLDSDIDIAILDGAEQPLSWGDQARLMDLLEKTLKRGVDLRILREGSPSYQAHVLEHGHLIWERQPGELARYAHEALAAFQAARQRAEEEWPHALSRLSGR